MAKSNSEELTLSKLTEAVAGKAAAFRCKTTYQPAGGPGDKVFPPTYEGGKYATEERVENGKRVPCVLLDSVQSQANRHELALLEAHRDGRIALPLLVTRFEGPELLKPFTVTSLEAPHRIADALFRDSVLDGTIFRQSEKGRLLDSADIRNATGLFGLCPTALLFGLWDSTGPRGGLGAKFQRAFVSEIIGIDAVPGKKTSSRIDPAQIPLQAGTLYARKSAAKDSPAWTLDPKLGDKKLGKDGKPSEANHGNVTPGITDGGFTIDRAVQTSVLSLTALRRLRFPLGGAASSEPRADVTARTVLAALGLAAAVLAREEGADLRSRCHLVATEGFDWELLLPPGHEPSSRSYRLDAEGALGLLRGAVEAAKNLGLPWEGEIMLSPSTELLELVRRGQLAAVSESAERA